MADNSDREFQRQVVRVLEALSASQHHVQTLVVGQDMTLWQLNNAARAELDRLRASIGLPAVGHF